MYKKYFADKKAAIFDLDGTIVDSLPIWENAYNEATSKMGLPGVDGRALNLGISLDQNIKNSFDFAISHPEITLEEARENIINTFITMFDEASNFLTVRDGFWEFISELKEKNYKLAIASNAYKKVVDHVTEVLELSTTPDLFDFIISGDEVRKRKPSPNIYNKVVKKLGVHKHETIVFEDSLAGAQAADKAKLDTIVIWNQEIQQEHYPSKITLFIPDFEGLSRNLDTDLFDDIEEYSKQYEEDSEQEQI